MNRLFAFTVVFLFSSLMLTAKDYSLTSPDAKIRVVVSSGDILSYRVFYNDKLIMGPSEAAMEMAGGSFVGRKETVSSAKTTSVNATIKPVVPHKNSTIADQYNLLTIKFKSGYSILFRAYNDGVAYR